MKTPLFLKTGLLALMLALFFPKNSSTPLATYDKKTNLSSHNNTSNTTNALFNMSINCGGHQVTYGKEIFQIDQDFLDSGKTYKNTAVTSIANTDRDAIYLTERSAVSGQSNIKYAIPVPDGTYTIKLHFAEIYWGAKGGEAAGPNDRVFDVSIEGNKVLSDLNIYKEVGSMTALVKTFTVTVRDNEMNINLDASKDQPKISALEIMQIDNSVEPTDPVANEAFYINSGGNAYKVGSKTFSADKYYKGGRKFSNNKITDIKGTTADGLYTSERSTGVDYGKFSYEIPVSGGEYEVKLHFAELWWGATGGLSPGTDKRKINVNLEGKSVISNLDLVKEYGSMTAAVKTYKVNVDDGKLNIDFSASKNEPKISAIEVVKVTNTTTNAVALINCGGKSVSFNGKTYAADKYYDKNSLDYQQSNGSINNTDEDAIYRSERISKTDKGSFGYAIPVDNGTYTVQLQFAEIYWKEKGKRLMNVNIEGKKAINGLDIFSTAGGNTALIESYSATVTDGTLNIDFSASKDRPKISAISVYSSNPTSGDLPLVLRLNTGGPAMTANSLSFKKDAYYSSRTQANIVNLPDIKNTEADAAYKTERSASVDRGSFSYNIPLSNGQYQVKLHFAEIWFGIPNGGPAGTGKRIFDVDIENNKVINDLDLTKETGGQTALIKSFMVNVTDGEMNIDFTATKNRPTISAIEIFGNGKLGGNDNSPCQWHDLASSAIKKVEAQSAKVDNKLYSLAGFTSGLKIIGTTEIYNPASDVWSMGAPMPVPVTHMGVCVVDKDIWVVGGFTGNDPGVATNKVQIYNTTTNSWRNGPSLPAPRGSGAAVYNAGKIHFFGGLLPDRKTDVDEHYVLDPKNLSKGWTPAARLPHARNHLSGASVNGIIYAIGGQYGHDNVEPKDQRWMEAYNPATDKWTRKADLPSARSHFEPGTIVHNGKIIIVGGRRGWLYFFNDITQYDPATNTWSELCKLPNRNMAAAAKVFGDRLIVANGGIDGERYPTDKTEWLPIDPENNQISTVAKKSLLVQDEVSTEVTLYPNPTTGDITLQLKGTSTKEKVSIVVKDMSGLPLMNKVVVSDINTSSYQLPTNTLKQGIYFVEVTQGSTIQKVVRFIKM